MSDLSPESSFEKLKSNVIKSVSGNFPIEGRKNVLVVENVHVKDDLDIGDIKSQLGSKERDGTWAVPVKGDLKLVDKATGKVIDHKKNAILAKLPKLTNRYGYIVGGTEYQVDHLFKLKSGVYSRVKRNGELETEFNLAESNTGKGFAINFDPKTMKFNMEYPKGSGAISMPLYPVMKCMGISDDEIEHSWGKKIFELNKVDKDKQFYGTLKKFWAKTSEDNKAPEPSNDQLVLHLRKFFEDSKLRPDTTKLTMGKPFSTVNAEALRIGAEKVLGISKGTHKPDERDSLAFKEVVSIDDFLPMKINKAVFKIKNKVRNNIDNKTSVSDILPPDVFGKHIKEFFTGGKSGVSERSDQTNPIQMLSAHTKTTPMSKEFGGLKNEQSIGDEMRIVSSSHFGFLDPSHTPEGDKTGITLHLSSMARKNGNDLEIPVYDVKSGKPVWSNVTDFHSKTAVLPDQVKWEGGRPVPVSSTVKVKLPGGTMEMRPYKDADYVMASSKGVFDHATNLVPFLASDQGNRVAMAAKQMEQAVSLKHREAPLTQCKTDSRDPNHTYEKLVGSFAVQKSTIDGKVIDITKEHIKIKGPSGESIVQVYDHFPLNDQKVMMHSSPLVKVGDEVKKGQVIADSNFTRNGTLAAGINLRYGLMPYKGYNFDDGVVISETAAKKLTSEHLYTKHLELESGKDVISATKLKAFAPVSISKMTKEQWSSLDSNGVIKVGEKVSPGQVMVAALGENTQGKNTLLARLGSKAIKPYKDKSLVWDEDHVGVVTRVSKLPNGDVKVFVKTEEPMVIGDKIAGRHGDKGIITAILPDHEMPFTKDEKGNKAPLEVVFNPLGIPSRINVGQMFEVAGNKIANKTGKPYIVNNFSSQNHHADVMADLKSHGVSEQEAVYDPSNPNKPLGSVMVGPKYTFKLRHQVEKKLHVRGGGTTSSGRNLPYSKDNQPTQGGEYGGQGYGQMDLYALLGYDARNTIREMSTYKSDLQDTSFWNMIQNGYEPPPPRVPFTYDKFTALLRAAGVNVTKEGTAVKLSPMTDKETLTLAGNGKNQVVKDHSTCEAGRLLLRAKDLKEEPDGLFDPMATGGIDGKKWSYIRLAEPVPNPIFVGQGNVPGPVPVLLNLKKGELDSIMDGKSELNGKVGGHAIADALKKIDVKKEIDSIRSSIKQARGTDLDRQNRKLRFLLALQDSKLTPHEAYMMNYLPVIPPVFRPISQTHKGTMTVSPLNHLYKNVALINGELGNMPAEFSEQQRKTPRADLWNGVKAISAVGNYRPIYEGDSSKGERELVGILDQLATGGGEHGQPKEGFVQEKLVKRRQNLSMRSTIVPEPALSLDEVGLPKGPAMELYKPYVVAQLGRWSVDPLTAQKKIQNGDPLAHSALEKVISERPLVLKRDPVLHKFNVVGLRPKLVEGKAIKVHPLITGGMNADFDGDTCAITVPMSKEAVEESKKMFPSNNIFSPASGDVMPVPTQETLLGLHLLSKWGKDSGKTVSDVKSLADMVSSGSMHMNDVVKVSGMFNGKPTTYGRILLESRMPRSFEKNKDILHDPSFEITAKSMRNTLAPMLAKGHYDEFARVADALKDLGNEHVYKMGFSVGLADVSPITEKKAILDAAHKKVAALTGDKETVERKTIDIYQEASGQLMEVIKNKVKNSNNRFGTLVLSGAKGKPGQLQQIIAAPMLMQDGMNNTIPTPVTKSYSEGLDIGDYWLAQHGARKGIIQKTMSSARPGALTKDIQNSTMGTVITSSDCGTKGGILLNIVPDPKDPSYKDVHDRFLAQSVKIKDEVIPEGTVITPDILTRMRNNKISKVVVRSPLKCENGDGICSKCYGIAEHGKLHPIGTNIGVLAGSALGEPATQMTLDAFHSGGTASGRGGASADRITRLTSLLTMPSKVKYQATIATTSGKVTAVQDAEAGGIKVVVDGVSHYVPRDLVNPDITVGQEVKKGDKLSDGFINPHHLLATTKDMHAVQNYLTKEMHEGIYDSEGVKRRNVEVAVRSLTNLTKINDPGKSHYEAGDVMPRSVIEEYNRNLDKGEPPISHTPILKGSAQIPALLTQNWMGRLNYRELSKTILEAAGKGEKAELHSTHPIPGIMYGAEFGKAPEGKPKYVY